MSDSDPKDTINSIDGYVQNILHQLYSINRNLNDGIHGESPTDASDSKEEYMPTPSLSSIAKKLNKLQTSLNITDSHVKHIHDSSPVKIAG